MREKPWGERSKTYLMGVQGRKGAARWAKGERVFHRT
jgi:hypothetical protein